MLPLAFNRQSVSLPHPRSSLPSLQYLLLFRTLQTFLWFMFSPIAAIFSVISCLIVLSGSLIQPCSRRANLLIILFNPAFNHFFNYLSRLAFVTGLSRQYLFFLFKIAAGTSSLLTYSGFAAAICIAMSLDKYLEFFICRRKVGFDINFYQYAYSSVSVYVRVNETFGCNPAPLF